MNLHSEWAAAIASTVGAQESGPVAPGGGGAVAPASGAAGGATMGAGTPTPATAPLGSVTQPATTAEGQPLGGTATVPNGTGSGRTPASPMGSELIFLMLGLLVFMILMSVMTGRKEKKKRAELMASLHNGAEVQTSGGIIGTVTQLRDDDLVLVLDQGRMRVARSAVVAVLKSKPGSEGKAGTSVEPKPGEVVAAR